jgi:hypothetical protein
MSASKKHDDRRKKQRPQQNGGFEIQDMGGGILRFPSSPPHFDSVPPKKPDSPPSMFGAEQVLRELQESERATATAFFNRLDPLAYGLADGGARP